MSIYSSYFIYQVISCLIKSSKPQLNNFRQPKYIRITQSTQSQIIFITSHIVHAPPISLRTCYLLENSLKSYPISSLCIRSFLESGPCSWGYSPEAAFIKPATRNAIPVSLNFLPATMFLFRPSLGEATSRIRKYHLPNHTTFVHP